MSTKVITNPKTGKMETIEVYDKVTKESLAELHKEVRDMLDGNKQFHVDPNAAPKVVPTTQIPDDGWDGYWGTV